MSYWVTFYCLLLVSVSARQSEETEDVSTECEKNCVGKEYQCIDGQCYCADGYVLNHFHSRCVRCPGLGERCSTQCCNRYGNGTLSCWKGTCQSCYDSYGNWVCSDSFGQVLFITGTEVLMGTALILGILATFILLYKLCASTNLRPLGNHRSHGDARLSIGSLQLYVEERLRDAPPRYTRAPAGGSAIYPTACLNAGFIHDSSLPPPPYSEERKDEVHQNTAVHI